MEFIKAVLFFGFVSLVLIMLLGVPEGSAKPQRVDQDFLAINNALQTYRINAGRPPTTAQGWEALFHEPTQGPKPKRWVQVIKKMPTDPWGTPYRYTLLGSREREWRWELRCAGPDGVFGNNDDLASEEESGESLIQSTEELPDEGSNSRPAF